MLYFHISRMRALVTQIHTKTASNFIHLNLRQREELHNTSSMSKREFKIAEGLITRMPKSEERTLVLHMPLNQSSSVLNI